MSKTAPARHGEAVTASITPDLESLHMQAALRAAYNASRASLAGRDIPPLLHPALLKTKGEWQ